MVTELLKGRIRTSNLDCSVFRAHRTSITPGPHLTVAETRVHGIDGE